MTDVNTLVIKELEKRLAIRMLEFEKIQGTINFTSDPGMKVRLEIQSKDILEEMGEIQNEIDRRHKSSQPKRYVLNALDDVFPKVDFEATVKLLREVFRERLRERSCGALTVLLQEVEEIRVADWYINRIKRDFFDGFYPEWCEVDVQTNTTTIEILKGISDKLHIAIVSEDSALDEDDYAIQLIDAIIKQSVGSSRVIFFRIANIDRLLLSQRHNFKEIHKFMRIFWKRLVSKLNKIARTYDDVWFVLCFVAEGRLTPASFPDHMRCTVDAFDEYKILELPIHNWRREDIEVCLKQYRGLSKHSAERWANYIHERSLQGMPFRVYRKILELDRDITNGLPR